MRNGPIHPTRVRRFVTPPAPAWPIWRWIALLLLLAWAAPSLAAFGIGLHMVLESHGPHDHVEAHFEAHFEAQGDAHAHVEVHGDVEDHAHAEAHFEAQGDAHAHVEVHGDVEDHAHAEAHAQDLVDLLRAAENGHRHENASVPDHEHQARAASSARPVDRLAAAEALDDAIDLRSSLTGPEPSSSAAAEPTDPIAVRPGCPAPLFDAHCALLL